MKTYEEVKADIDYLYSKINWGSSFLDAKAIQIMNELPESIRTMKRDCCCTPDETTGNLSAQCCNICGGYQEPYSVTQ